MFKILDEVCTPTRGSKYSACIDVKSRVDITIGAGETVLVPLGIKIDNRELERIALTYDRELTTDVIVSNKSIDDKIISDFKKTHYLQLMLRSSLGKKGLILPNGVGVIDLDYQDELMMIIHNPIRYKNAKIGDKGEFILFNSYMVNEVIKKGDRIGQITLLEHKSYLFGIDSKETRNGGFGSSGK